MGFIKNLATSFVANNFARDAEKVLKNYQPLGVTERSVLKVSVIVALAKLVYLSESNRESTFRILTEAMYSGSKLTDEQIGLGSMFNLRLIEMQKVSYSSTSPIEQYVAAGIPVWIMSIRALSNANVLPYARELWSILQNSDINRVYDQTDQIANQYMNHPIQPVLLRFRQLSTPTLFA